MVAGKATAFCVLLVPLGVLLAGELINLLDVTRSTDYLGVCRVAHTVFVHPTCLHGPAAHACRACSSCTAPSCSSPAYPTTARPCSPRRKPLPWRVPLLAVRLRFSARSRSRRRRPPAQVLLAVGSMLLAEPTLGWLSRVAWLATIPASFAQAGLLKPHGSPVGPDPAAPAAVQVSAKGG